MEESQIIRTEYSELMKKSYIDYAMSVIIARALPDVRDGMKPVHRRIIYTMNDSKNTYDKPYRKCAYTVGEVLGKYHPHGDASVYDALVRLAQKFSLRYPLIDGHGNFGSIDGDPPAAYRYTEARMSKIAGEMLTDIEKETIPYTTNYDDKLKEPVVLPSRFPNLLVNGSVGIAVGMATNIPPHNLGEVIDAIDLVMDNPDCTLDEIMEHIKGPDFPTGGIIMGRAGIRAAYATGRGKITLRANTTIEEIKGRQCIIVHEIPYMVNKARLVESMANLVKDKRIDGVHFIRDESGREGMRIVVELKKDAIPQIVLNKLFSYTQLQDTVGVIMLALVDGEPKVLTLKQTIEQYIKFQVEVIRRRTEYDLKKAKHRAHILEGLVIAADNIDEVVEICKTSENIPHSKQRLQERFNLTEIQAEAIVQMTLGKLTGLERQKILDELDELMKKIEELEAILADENKVHQIIKDELAEKVSEKFTPKQLVTDVRIICADSASEEAKEKVQASLDIMREEKAQFLILHPPYDDIIKFSDKKEDLSNCDTTEEFYELFAKVAKNGYDMLEKGRFAALIIGDSYKNSEVQPLGFECMAKMMNLGFKLKGIIVKDIQGNERAKGKTANLWRYRALAGGFFIFKHEYVMIFQKA